MNILGVCHFEFYQYPDASFVHQQAKEFANAGHKVRILVLAPFAKKGVENRYSFRMKVREIDNVEVCYLRYLSLSNYGKSLNVYSAIVALKAYWPKIFKDFIPDVIHSHTIGNIKLSRVIRRCFSSAVVIATAHGSDVNALYSKNELAEISNQCLGADAIISVSSNLENKLQQSGVATKIRTILNGFSKKAFQESSVIPKKPGSWIQVGHLIKSKNVDTTLFAFAKWVTKYPESQLLIIGEGSERTNLENIVKTNDIPNVVFLGQQRNEIVLRHMLESEYFVMVSSPEGLGIVYLEAMSCGCVAIGTKGEGIEDVIENGINGFLVDVKSAEQIYNIVEKCHSDERVKQRIITEARRTAGALTWQENAKNVIELFEECKERQDGY